MFGAGSAIKVEAYAKINLTLEILGRRCDGYHELRSIVMPVSLADTIALTTTYAQTVITTTAEKGVDMAQMCSASNNLAVRAARLMQERYKVNAGARIHIHKRIPIGGGLGGGSANAAGVIKGLDRLWELHRPKSELMSIGAELGSDIPALIHGGAVLMEGRGEAVRPLFVDEQQSAPHSLWLVIANPGVMCSTPEIFKKWRSGLTPHPLIVHNMSSFIRTSDVKAVASMLYNGLQDAVFESYPVVAQTAMSLKKAGCVGVLLSGSGASVFGLARDEGHGHEIRSRLGSGVWHVLVRTCPVV